MIFSNLEELAGKCPSKSYVMFSLGKHHAASIKKLQEAPLRNFLGKHPLIDLCDTDTFTPTLTFILTPH